MASSSIPTNTAKGSQIEFVSQINPVIDSVNEKIKDVADLRNALNLEKIEAVTNVVLFNREIERIQGILQGSSHFGQPLPDGFKLKMCPTLLQKGICPLQDTKCLDAHSTKVHYAANLLKTPEFRSVYCANRSSKAHHPEAEGSKFSHFSELSQTNYSAARLDNSVSKKTWEIAGKSTLPTANSPSSAMAGSKTISHPSSSFSSSSRFLSSSPSPTHALFPSFQSFVGFRPILIPNDESSSPSPSSAVSFSSSSSSLTPSSHFHYFRPTPSPSPRLSPDLLLSLVDPKDASADDDEDFPSFRLFSPSANDSSETSRNDTPIEEFMSPRRSSSPAPSPSPTLNFSSNALSPSPAPSPSPTGEVSSSSDESGSLAEAFHLLFAEEASESSPDSDSSAESASSTPIPTLRSIASSSSLPMPGVDSYLLRRNSSFSRNIVSSRQAPAVSASPVNWNHSSAKIVNVGDQVQDYVDRARVSFSRHAQERLDQREFTYPQILHVLQTGKRVEQSDRFDSVRNVWTYAIEGPIREGGPRMKIVFSLEADRIHLITLVKDPTKQK